MITQTHTINRRCPLSNSALNHTHAHTPPLTPHVHQRVKRLERIREEDLDLIPTERRMFAEISGSKRRGNNASSSPVTGGDSRDDEAALHPFGDLVQPPHQVDRQHIVLTFDTETLTTSPMSTHSESSHSHSHTLSLCLWTTGDESRDITDISGPQLRAALRLNQHHHP